MPKFTPTRRGNPCQICEDTSGKCREHCDGEIFLCMAFADARLGEIQNGLKCIKPAKGGNWATFKLDNSQEWSDQQRLEWQQRNQQRRQLQANANDERRRRSLPAVERDRQYREILAQLSLHSNDRADLVRRGFTDEQIELCGFKSIGRYQRLQARYSELLPGVTGNGDRLTIRDEGYLCPIRNVDGLIVACQVRLRSLPTSESNRYRWLSGDGRTLHLYPDGCKPEGELPLAVFRPQGKPRGISLAEGTGAKPFLVSQRLNQLVISAAGGQWASSEATFKLSLDRASLELGGVKELSICPDAGDINNPSVMKRWGLVVELLEEWGWNVVFAWWGQIDKSHPDIDELNDFSAIQFISPREFLRKGDKSWDVNHAQRNSENSVALTTALHQPLICNKESLMAGSPLSESEAISKHFSSSPNQQNCLGSNSQSTTSVVSELLTDTRLKDSQTQKSAESKPSLRPLRRRIEKVLKKSVKAIQSVEAKTQSVTKAFGSSDDTPKWKRDAHTNWKRNRQFTNTIQSSDKWVDWEKPAENTIFFGKSGLGSGKTTQLRKWVKQWKETEDVSFLCLGYRNTLLLQLCGDKKGLGFHHLHEHSGMAMKSAPSEGIALCVDSLWRFSPEDFDDKIIILDEVKSVVKHLLHSSTVKNRDKIISLFTEAIRRARQVICLDGLMADWVVDYLHSLAPEKQIIRAENTCIGEKPRVNFLLGTVGTDDKVKVNDRSPWLKYLLEESLLPAVCADSQVMIEALDELLTAKGLKVLRVDSKTVAEQYVKDFLLNCDEYIEQHRPDVLLYTPSAESGVDVSIPNHFTHHFAFFFGVLDVDGILQMIGRIRDNIVKFVWCKSFVADDEKQHSGSPFTDQIAKSIIEIFVGDIATSADGDNWLDTVGNHLKAVIANSIDQNFRTSCIIKSIQNYEKSNLRECLREELIESGYKVVNCTLESYEDAGKKAKEATEAVKRQNCADIFRAEKVAPELVDELKFDASWEERCKVIQAKLREKLPGIEDSPVWTEDFIYLTRYDDRNFVNNIENYWLFTHPDIAKRQSQDNLHWMARRLHTFIGNVKSRWARIHALLEMKFEQFLDPDKEWSNESPELIALVELGKKYSNPLGRHPGKATPVQFLGNLLGLFGLKLKSRKDGEGRRWYRLDEEVISDPIRQQVLTCVETKLTQPKEKIDWESAINEAHCTQTEKQPEVQTEQALEVTAPSPNFLYTNYSEGAVNNSTSESHEVDQISGGVSEPVEPMTAAEVGEVTEAVEGIKLVELLATIQTAEAFAQTVQGLPSETVEDAIASQDTQPKRLQLTEWYAAAAKLVEVTEATATRPSLEEYQPGQEVWAYFPQSQDGWLKGVVEWVRGNTVRVVSGWFGMFAETPDAIAPGDWILTE